MDAEPIVLFCRKSLSLREVEAILLTSPANDPPVNPKGDDVYLYKALNAIKEGEDDRTHEVKLPAGEDDRTHEVKLPAGEDDRTHEVKLPAGEDDRTHDVKLPAGEDDRTDEAKLPAGEDYQTEEMKKPDDWSDPTTFEKALVGNLSSAKDYLQLWTAYCDYFRRRVTTETPQEAELAELRKTFKRARDYMEAYYEQIGDPSESLARYQARLEAYHYGNVEEVRSLWDGIMSRHGKEAQYWLEYAQLERYCGELESCRKLLYRAVNSASDNPELVCETLLQFEREEGTVESYEEALERCASQMTRVLERRERAAEKEAQKKDEKRERKREKKQRPQSSNQGSNRPPQRKKDPYSLTFYEGGDGPRRDQEEREEGEESRPAKKPRGKEREEEDVRPVKKARVADAVELHDVQPAVTMETSDAAPLSPPPPPPPSSAPSQEPSQPSVGDTDEEGGGNESATKEQRTVFISNLRFLTTEEQLREKLGEEATSECFEGAVSSVQPDIPPQAEDQDSPSTSISDEITASREVCVEDTSLVLECLGESPVKLGGLNSLQKMSRGKRKLDQASTALKRKLEEFYQTSLDGVEEPVKKPRGDDIAIYQNLMEKFSKSTSYQEKLQILTLSPFTIEETQRFFQATNYMVKKSRKLREAKGVLSMPDKLSRGYKLSDEVKAQVVAYDECDEVSRVCPDEFIEDLADKVSKLTRHHYIAHKQALYLKNLKESLALNECIIHGDFSENSSFVVQDAAQGFHWEVVQDAAQGFHWENSQATLHPYVVYYKTAEGVLQAESHCVISDCKEHSASTVYQFQKVLLQTLKVKHPSILKVHYFTDGCGGQHKNRYNLVNLCHHELDFGLLAECNFCATSHGKGAVKRGTLRASLQRPVSAYSKGHV
eukprot:Em0014g155a